MEKSQVDLKKLEVSITWMRSQLTKQDKMSARISNLKNQSNGPLGEYLSPKNVMIPARSNRLREPLTGVKKRLKSADKYSDTFSANLNIDSTCLGESRG